MESKPWWKSRTIWVNIISALLEVAQMLTGTSFVPAGTITLISNVLNIALRYVTKAPIG